MLACAVILVKFILLTVATSFVACLIYFSLLLMAGKLLSGWFKFTASMVLYLFLSASVFAPFLFGGEQILQSGTCGREQVIVPAMLSMVGVFFTVWVLFFHRHKARLREVGFYLSK